jgi:uncharacterized delta-60 repeat protein
MIPRSTAAFDFTVAAIAIAALLGLPGSAAAVDGVLDPTFSGNGLDTVNFDLGAPSYDQARSVAVQTDGKVVAVGLATWSLTDADFAITRHRADGAPDPTFDVDGRAHVNFDVGPDDQHWFDQALDVAIQADGRIVICGTATVDADDTQELAVVRLEADGDTDPTWNSNGRRRYDVLPGTGSVDSCAIVAQRDEKIAIVWSSQDGRTGVTRLLSNSNPDLAWPGGTVLYPCDDFEFLACDFTEILELPGGRLALAGSVRVDASSDDLAFAIVSPGGGFGATNWDDSADESDEWPFGIGLQSDGAIVVGFNQADTEGGGMRAVRFPRNSLSLDPDFGDTGVAQIELSTVDDETSGNGLVVGGDDRIAVIGYGYDETRFDCLTARFLPDGENLDTSFGTGGRTRVSFASGVVQEQCTGGDLGSGRVALAGFSWQQSDYDFAIARLTEDLVFRNGFEIGSTWFWSSTTP